MMMRTLLLPLMLLGLSACMETVAAPEAAPPPLLGPPPPPVTPVPAAAQDTCGAAEWAALVGASASTAQSALAPDIAQGLARVITPESAVTADFLAARLNVTVGDDGTVARLSCG